MANNPQPLRDGALVSPKATILETDILIIGSGMGGSTLAWALRDSGREVVVVERGDFLPREPENASAEQMYLKKRYTNAEKWVDRSNGDRFQPGVYYWVGGNTKFYGASLPRFREEDFGEINHHDGLSRAWPFSYSDIEPYYAKAEELYEVHGAEGEDPTEPFHSTPFPRRALQHEPTVQRFADSLVKQGLHPFHMSNALNVVTKADRLAETISDGAPSETGLKSEAENRALRPALESEHVKLLTRAKVTKLLTNADGTRVTAAEAVVDNQTITIKAKQFVVSAGAANSAALLLASANEKHPNGLSNSSGVLGRNYMVHNSTFFMAFNPFRRNKTLWQKTLGLNDWYLAGPQNEFPLGNLQMLGKLQAPMVKGARPKVPLWLLKFITDRTLDIYLTTEDLPDPDNRVEVENGQIIVSWKPNNIEPHKQLVKNVSRAARKAGYPIILTQRMGIATNSHMCGTVVAGTDPATSVLDENCRSYDVENLWVVDGSFFPSSGALNPALTIAANALRVAPLIAAAD